VGAVSCLKLCLVTFTRGVGPPAFIHGVSRGVGV